MEKSNNNQIKNEEYLGAVQKIHQSETKPIKIYNDEGAPSLYEVIQNQKRLAIMIEYAIQSLQQSNK